MVNFYLLKDTCREKSTLLPTSAEANVLWQKGQRAKGEGRTVGVDRTERGHEEFCGLYGNLALSRVYISFYKQRSKHPDVREEL